MKMSQKVMKYVALAVILLAGGAAFAESLDKEGEWKKSGISVSRGKALVCWAKDVTADQGLMLTMEATYKYKEDGETYEDVVYETDACDRENSSGGYDQYVVFRAEEWSYIPDSVSKISFTVYVSGWYDEAVPANNKFTFGKSNDEGDFPGEIEPVIVDPKGSMTNPMLITPKETTTPVTGATMTSCEPGEESDGTYYLKTTSLTAGHKYFFGIDNGSDFFIGLSNQGDNLFLDPACSKEYDGWEDCLDAYSFVPPVSGVYYLKVTTEASFTFYSAKLPAWTPAQHASTPLGVGETSEPFAPGYLCDPEGSSYDAVIDQELFEVSDCVKGQSYVFSTEGANAELLMRVYDAKGNVLAENYFKDHFAYDVQCVWTAPATYSARNNAIYVGVCQVLEDGVEPYAGEVTLTVREVTPETTLENLVATPSGMEAKPSAENSLTSLVWANTFAIAARAGVTYNVKSAADDEAAHGLTLGCKVYTLSGTRITELTPTKGGLSGNIDRRGGGIEFTPTAHGTVYIDVFVADGEWGNGQGLDYGPYTVTAKTVSGEYGVLTVDLAGASQSLMGWKLVKYSVDNKTWKDLRTPAEVVYPAGASTVLPVGYYKVRAEKVTGFVDPDQNDGFAVAGITANLLVTAEYQYCDKYDPADDELSGSYVDPTTKRSVKYAPVTLKPSAKGETVSRSLWKDDARDWFSFSGAEGTYYKFAFIEKTGTPVVRVYEAKAGVTKVEDEDDLSECTYRLAADPSNVVQVCCAKKGTYYVKVTHADELSPADSAYTLLATSAAPGSVKLGKSEISVKEGVASVDLSVSRTGKEGVVRVKYATKADTAKPGEDYYPTSGVLTWADGDQKAQTVRVKLIPELVQAYVGDRSFDIVFETFPEDELGEDEYIPAFATDTKTKLPVDSCEVTITEASKVTPGTIQVADDGQDVKKPLYTVVAGEELEISVARISGESGTVGVKFETVKGTANKSGETDYVSVVTNLVWEDGETAPQTVTIVTKPSPDATDVKKFTAKLTALTTKGYSKPTLAASTITVNLKNSEFDGTFADYVKANPTIGVAVKEKKSGSWVVGYDGAVKCVGSGELTFTLTGPGVFKYSVDGQEQEPVTVEYGQRTGNVVTIDDDEKLDWYRWEPIPENLVKLRQCVKYEYVITSAVTKVAVGKLPDGLKLAQNTVTKKWSIAGTPTKAGYFYVKLSDGKKTSPVEEEINYCVTAAGAAIGTFNGLVTTFDTDDGLRSLASVQVTATAAGKLSAKVTIGGKAQSFSDTGYASFDETGDYPTVTAEMVQIVKVGAGRDAETVTNWFYCTVVDAPESDSGARVQEGSVRVQFAKLADATGKQYDEDVWYEGKICRDNSKLTDWAAEAAAFAGYYTVSLANPDAQPGEPKGNGYLTFTVDAKGKVKIAGMLADGTAYSGSSLATYLIRRDDETALRVPLYACKGTYVFGGWLELKVRDGLEVPVVSYDAPDTDLVWKNDSATSTSEGEYGFSLYLYPVGGWYDTVKNLQRWFLDYDFSVDLPSWDEDFEELMPAGYEAYAFAANPCGQAVDVQGDTVSVAKQVLVKDAETKLNDFAASVNPSNVKFTFKRATGILNGTFDLWYEGYNEKTKKTEQKTLSGLKHNGVLLLSRGDDGYLEDNVWTSGFYLGPKIKCTDWTKSTDKKTVTYDWTGSYRFDIKATKVDRDWTEAED